MQDTARHSAPQPDEVRHTLTVRDVERLLAEAGVQRSHRHVLRMCQTGMLDAVKFPGGPTGDEWHVAPASVPKAIGDLKQIDAQRARHSAPQPAMSNSVAPELERDINTATAGHSRLQPAMSDEEEGQKVGETEPAAARYVQQLEKRIEEKDDVIILLKGQLTAKDEQISELSTRYRETHTLLGAMQRMIAPLLGQADPYTPPESREAADAGDHQPTAQHIHPTPMPGS
jgi:hypothetical protein